MSDRMGNDPLQDRRKLFQMFAMTHAGSNEFAGRKAQRGLEKFSMSTFDNAISCCLSTISTHDVKIMRNIYGFQVVEIPVAFVAFTPIRQVAPKPKQPQLKIYANTRDICRIFRSRLETGL